MKPLHCIILLLGVAAQSASADIVLPDAFAAVKASASVPDGAQRQAVRIDAAALAAVPQGGRFSLPGRDALTAVSDVSSRRDDHGRLVWSARVDTRWGPQSAVLVVGEGGSFGLIPQPDGKPLRLETRQGQAWIVHDTRTPLPPREDDVLIPPPGDAASRALRKRQDATPAAGEPVVDVLVLYTPALVRVWGSNAAVEARIAYLEALSNQAYIDSNTAIRVRVVASHLLGYTDNNDNSTALRAITLASDLPVKAEVDRLRALYGADLVKLMRNFDRVSQSSCGNGWLGGYHGNAFVPEYGFSETSDHGFGGDNCGEFTFTHELGHNMGAHHDFETADGDYGAYTYSRGYRRTIDDDSGFATIMAYPTGPQTVLGRLSNPRVSSCLSLPCGDAVDADNARGLGEAASAVAGLLPTVNESGISVSLGDVTVTEGNAGQRVARFPIILSGPSANGVTLSLATAHGSTTVADIAMRTTTLFIPAGQTTSSYDVQVRGDTLPEFDEYFSLEILAATGARIADGQGVGTIVNDDPLPMLSVEDIRVDEGTVGPKRAVFTARLSQASAAEVRFDAASGQYGGSNAARSGEDFIAMDRRGIRIPPGETEVQFHVDLLPDGDVEPDERFYVVIGGVEGATIDDVIIRADLLNDDGMAAAPELVMADGAFTEGSAGPRTVVAEFSLSAPASREVRFGVMAVAGTAEPGEDYDFPTQVVTVPVGQTTGGVSIYVIPDTQDEADETLTLRAFNLVGAVPGKLDASITLLDDDGGAYTPPMVARDDRAVVPENAAGFEIDVLANDALNLQRLAGGSLVITEAPAGGTLAVDSRGTSGTVADDRLVYTPPPDWSGERLAAYRVCEQAGRCTEAAIVLVVRPHPGLEVDNATGAGHVDIPVSGLRAMPDARFAGSYQALGKPMTATLSVDPTPEYPWDAGGAGFAQWILPSLLGPSNHQLVDARSISGGDVDLYVGVDLDMDGEADPEEVRCVSASDAPTESCELPQAFIDPAGNVPTWVAMHNRSATAQTVEGEWYEFYLGLDWERASGLRASGPGHLAGGEAFPVRLVWSLPGQPAGRRMASLVQLRATPEAEPAMVPVRFRRDQVVAAGRALHRFFGVEVFLPAGGTHDRLYVDVPPGATQLRVSGFIQRPVDLHLIKAVAPEGPGIDRAPPIGTATASRLGASSAVNLTVSGEALTPGRWYVTVVDSANIDRDIYLEAVITGSSATPQPGSYFNPDRSGHGLFIYPAGSELAGLWYTYLQDGSSTWYYLQGEQPGGDGVWRAELYRASWNGSSNHLVDVGDAIVTSSADGGLAFSYFLDGQQGSERLQALGSGCPTLAGQPLDASSHWFDPAKAGTGYSVQLFPDYEFHAAFVYDVLGVPRFLTAESGSFRGADATLALEQLTGFCPLCERTGAPTRADIGTLRRRFDASGLVQMQLDAVYTGGVPGAWTGNDSVQLLGGPGTTQGCPTP